MRLHSTAALLLALGAFNNSIIRADQRGADAAIAALGEKIEVKLPGSTNLEQIVALANQTLAARGIDATVTVNTAAFRAENPEFPELTKIPVKLPAAARPISVGAVLRSALGQMPGPATFLVRRGNIEITTTKHADLNYLLHQKVTAVYQNVPLSAALDDIADVTGISVIVDRRVEDYMHTPVSGRFRGNVSAIDAVRLLAQSAELKVVMLPTALYVTSAATAASLRDEQANWAPPVEPLPEPAPKLE